MKILFLHGWHSVPGGVKPTYLKRTTVTKSSIPPWMTTISPLLLRPPIPTSTSISWTSSWDRVQRTGQEQRAASISFDNDRERSPIGG